MIKHVNAQHELYTKYSPAWRKCRIVSEGSEAVKALGVEFLPMLEDQLREEYEKYKYRALFFEGTTRTITGLLGMMFAKEPTIKSTDNSELLNRITPQYTPLKTFLKNLVKEVLTVGRAGLLVDVDASGQPYVLRYTAEDILNWRVAVVKGQRVVSLVVLREYVDVYDQFEKSEQEQFRVLQLDEQGFYFQEVYQRSSEHSDEFVLVEGYPSYPLKKGHKLDQIPFYFVNAQGMQPDPERPPLVGLVNVNLSHYLNSADLEHGRHFTGLPTPWVAGFATANNQKLSIGSQVAWVSSKPEAKAGYLEFTGQGLTTLENALKEKQELMIVLGARLLETPKKVSESHDNQAMRKQGENSVLSNIADSVSDAVTLAVQFAAMWSNESPANFSIEIHKDFIALSSDPDLIKAMLVAIQGGLMSFETWFYNNKKTGMYPSGHDIETEKLLIDAQNTNFLNDN